MSRGAGTAEGWAAGGGDHMTFTDDLTLVLDLLNLVAATVCTGLFVWFQVCRKDLVRANTNVHEGATLLGTLGGVLGIIAL